MENVNVILSLLGFLGVGSAAIHYTSCRKVQVQVKAKKLSQQEKRGEDAL